MPSSPWLMNDYSTVNTDSVGKRSPYIPNRKSVPRSSFTAKGPQQMSGERGLEGYGDGKGVQNSALNRATLS